MSARAGRNPRFPIPGGAGMRARGWRQEGLLRLLENVLCVGEDPDNLVVYAALGKAARNWAAHEAIVSALTTMNEGETLVVQSGKPIGLLTTHPGAPLVITLPAQPSQAPERPLRAVPDVRGLDVRAAVRSLHSAGFKVQLSESGSSSTSNPGGATSPAAGELARTGTVVRLIIDY